MGHDYKCVVAFDEAVKLVSSMRESALLPKGERSLEEQLGEENR